MDSLPARLATCTAVAISGTWQRHVAARFVDAGLTGRSANGRWGTEGSFPVLYLGKPTDSVAVEAYRHLVDPVVADDNVQPQIRPRALITCEVSVTEILDLRSSNNRVLAGISLVQLQSETSDKAAYSACQNVSAAAHQLGYHGISVPAATKWVRPSPCSQIFFQKKNVLSCSIPKCGCSFRRTHEIPDAPPYGWSGSPVRRRHCSSVQAAMDHRQRSDELKKLLVAHSPEKPRIMRDSLRRSQRILGAMPAAA